MREPSLNHLVRLWPSRRLSRAGCLAGLLLFASPLAHANVILVAASTVGPGGTACSLVDAINAANNNAATGACPAGDDKTNGGDVIVLAAGTYKIGSVDNDWYGPNGLPAITSNITIVGDPKGTVIMRSSNTGVQAFRIFYVGGGQSLTSPPTNYNPPTDFSSLPGPGNLTLINLTIENGLAQGGAGGNSTKGPGGGGLGAGGAIYNQGTLTLQGVTLVGNQALGGAGGQLSTNNGDPGGGGGMAGAGDGFGNGGGFNTNGPWPDSTTPSGEFGNGGDANQAGGVGGGGGSGGAGGFGGGGGGGGSAVGGFGGGLGFIAGGFGGSGMGGAIFNEGGTLTLSNCTLTGNNAGGGAGGFAGVGNGVAEGGAIFNLNGTVSISFSTIANNTLAGTTGDGGALYSLQQATPGSPAADAHSSASVNVGSSILYGSILNTTDSSGNVTSSAATDCLNSSGSFSGSPNALGATSATCTESGDVSPNPLLLLPLANNGGPTQTMGLVLPLGPGASVGAPALDQRGYLRTTPDIGAYEISNTAKSAPSFSGLQATTLVAGANASLAWFNLTGNDSTQPALTVAAISSDTTVLPAANLKLSANCGGSLSLDTCSLSLSPTAKTTGSAGVILSATNGYGQTGYGSFPVSVIPPSPVAQNDSETVASGQTLNSALMATDALTVTLTYTILTQPAHGTLKLSSANSSSYTYTPAAGFIGADSFTWQANDGSTDSNIGTVSITVTVPAPPPGAPTVSDMSFSVKVSTPLKGTLQASGASLGFAIATKPTHGTVSITDATTGAFTYTPTTGYAGNDSFTYTATNTLIKATSNPATVSLAVSANGTGTQTTTGSGSGSGSGSGTGTGSGSGSGTNSAAPIASAMTLASYANTPLSNVLTASDAAGNALSFTVSQPGHGTVTLSNATTGAFTYTPAAGYTGSDSFTFTATDTVTKLDSGATSVSITLAALPISSTAAPIVGNSAFTSYVNVAVSGSLSASDAAGNALSYTLVTPPAHGTVTVTSTTGAFTYTPTTGYIGSDSFTFTATDSISGVASSAGTISLTLIALPPPAPAPPSVSAASFSTYENAPINGNLTASDAAGDAMTYAPGTVVAAHGTMTITNTATGAFTYTPNAGYIGSDGFTFTATDGVASPPLTSASAMVLITVNALPPPAPVAGTLSVTTYAGIPVSGILPASDGAGLAMTYAATTSAQGVTGILTSTTTGAFTYTPPVNVSSDSFTYTVTDSTNVISAPGTVNVAIIQQPTTGLIPPLANNAAVTVYENGTLTAKVSGVPVTAGDTLSYATMTPPSHGILSAIGSDGSYTYTPTANYAGADSFAYTVKDGTAVSSPAAVVITVASLPIPATPPQASGANLSLYTGQALSGTLVAVGTTSDALGYSVVQPSHGTVNLTDSTTGTFVYTPNTGYTGSDSFTFTAVDTVNNAASNIATINLTINALPVAGVPPLASGANLSVYSGQPLSGTLAAVDAAANALSYAATTQPSHGTLKVKAATGAYTYTPTSGYAGKDAFTFTATDTVTHLASSAATMDITVVSPPLAAVAPLANGLSLTVYAGQPLTSVLSAVDVNGNPVSYTITTQPKHGSVALTATTGEFVYTPAGGYTGSDSFAYTATDTTSKLASSAANVALTVVPGPPTAVHHGGPAIGGGGYGPMYLLILAMLLRWRQIRSGIVRRRGRYLATLVAACVVLLPVGALNAAEPAAEDNTIPAVDAPLFDAWYIGGQASLIKPDSSRDAAARGLKGWGILVGKELGDYSLEFSADYHADTPKDLQGIANWKTYGADGLWYFTHRQSSLFTPFAFAGLGLADQYNGDDSKKRSAYGNIGIGFDSTPWRSIPLKFRVDAQLEHVFSGYNDLVLSLGIAVRFGGTPPPVEPLQLPDTSPLNKYPMAWCTEQGGEPQETDSGWVCILPNGETAQPPATTAPAATTDSPPPAA